MNNTALIASLVDSLVWPVTVLIAIVLLRRPLAQLIPQLSKVKYGKWEADFGNKVQQIKREVEKALPAAAAEKAEAEAGPEADLAEVAPNAAVLEAWNEVEGAAKTLVNAHGDKLDLDGPSPFLLLERVLDKGELIERPKVKIFRDLRQLRNRVAHAGDYEVSRDQAKQYTGLARALATNLHDEADKVKATKKAGG